MPNPATEFASGFTRGIANALGQKRQEKQAAQDRQQKNAQAALHFLVESGQLGDISDAGPIADLAFGFWDGSGGKKPKTPKGQTDPQQLVNSLLGPALANAKAAQVPQGGGPFPLSGAANPPVDSGIGAINPPQPGVAMATEGQPAQAGRSIFGVPLLSRDEVDDRALDRSNRLLTKQVDALMAQDPAMTRIQAVQMVMKHNLPAERAESTTSGDFSLGPDQIRFDKSGAEIARGMPKPETPNAVNAGSFEDYVQRYASEKGKTPKDVTTAEIQTLRKQYMQADDRPTQGSDTAARRQEHKAQMAKLVDVVVANPSAFDNLTPTIQAEIIPDLAARGFTGFGKMMNETAIKQISETKSAMDSLRDLRQTLKENEQYIGPIAGFQALNPYSEARKAQSKIDLVKQRVGKALEGGVLRKEDEEKYKKILATLSDEPSTAIYKVDSLITTLERDLQNYVNEQRMAGRRVGTEAPAGGAKTEGADRIAARKYLLDNGLPTSDANIDFYLKNAKK